ncbi:MAG: PCYCGC domain-containing protein [Acidobacteria bacterium]|nr:PCYCGC domain-containing protein [Acidobacteriota bacterium]
MKTKNGLLIIAGLACIALAVVLFARQPDPHHGRRDAHAGSTQQNRVPAYNQTPPARENLGPTLPPEKFTGKTREAYKVVREIPQTIAQLPCYCYCDEGHGHKSLYSCFEDEHAASCAVCVQEALLAFRLEKGEGLTAPQIREWIIETYSKND